MYTDFAWIARRHGIENRDAAFTMASDVIASIASSVRQRRAEPLVNVVGDSAIGHRRLGGDLLL